MIRPRRPFDGQIEPVVSVRCVCRESDLFRYGSLYCHHERTPDPSMVRRIRLTVLRRIELTYSSGSCVSAAALSVVAP